MSNRSSSDRATLDSAMLAAPIDNGEERVSPSTKVWSPTWLAMLDPSFVLERYRRSNHGAILIALRILVASVAVAITFSVAEARANEPTEIVVQSSCPMPDVFVIVQHATPPDPSAAALPPEARSAFRDQSQRRATRRNALRAYQRSQSDDDRQRRDEAGRAFRAADERLLALLERHRSSLTAEAWLLLAQLRFEVPLGRAGNAPGAEYGEAAFDEPDYRPAVAAARYAAALGGLSETGMWARYFDAHVVARIDDAEAIRALRIVIAHSSGTLLAHALLDIAQLYGEANDIALSNRYIDRALPLLQGEDVTAAHIVTFLNNVNFDPNRAFDHAMLYLRESRDARDIAQGAIAYVGQLVRSGPSMRRARVLAELPTQVRARVMCEAEPTPDCAP